MPQQFGLMQLAVQPPLELASQDTSLHHPPPNFAIKQGAAPHGVSFLIRVKVCCRFFVVLLLVCLGVVLESSPVFVLFFWLHLSKRSWETPQHQLRLQIRIRQPPLPWSTGSHLWSMASLPSSPSCSIIFPANGAPPLYTTLWSVLVCQSLSWSQTASFSMRSISWQTSKKRIFLPFFFPRSFPNNLIFFSF